MTEPDPRAGYDGDPNKDGPGRRLSYAVIAVAFAAILLAAAADWLFGWGSFQSGP